MPLKLTTYSHGSTIPDLPGSNTFHSTELFRTYEATPGYTPLLIVATQDGEPIAKLLAVIRTSKRLFPPGIIKRCEIYGNGEYFSPTIEKEVIFNELLKRLTSEALRRCFLIEFRNIENSMFAYKNFRAEHYFPINWLCVRNSLHRITKVEEQFSNARVKQIRRGLKNGAIVRETTDIDEICTFARMLHRYYSSKVRKHFPSIDFFIHLAKRQIPRGEARIFIVTYKQKIIGGSVCFYSDEQAYVWFSGGMRKRYALQQPGILAVWKAMQDAKQRGYHHIEFMDVGLPFRRHGYRDFVLQFGGKQISTRRWFRFRWEWLNRMLTRLYN